LREVIDKGTAPETRRKAQALTLGANGEMCKLTWKERADGSEIRDSTLEGYLNHLKDLLCFERVEIMLDGVKLIHFIS